MTTLIKQSPPLFELEGMDRWLNNLLAGPGFGPLIKPSLLQPTFPAADVYISGGKYVIELEVPGFLEKELTIEVYGRVLTITGIHAETTETAKTFRLHERLATEFERTFMLPLEFDGEHVTATFVSGVLKVFAPLPATTEPYKVPDHEGVIGWSFSVPFRSRVAEKPGWCGASPQAHSMRQLRASRR